MILRQTHNNKTGDWTPKNQDFAIGTRKQIEKSSTSIQSQNPAP